MMYGVRSKAVFQGRHLKACVLAALLTDMEVSKTELKDVHGLNPELYVPSHGSCTPYSVVLHETSDVHDLETSCA